MTAKQQAWIAAYAAGITNNNSHSDLIEIANRAAADYESAFPEQPEPIDMQKYPVKTGEFIIISVKDADDFELPEWAKAGEKCIHAGVESEIDFIGIDADGNWCCLLITEEDYVSNRKWAFVEDIKPVNG